MAFKISIFRKEVTDQVQVYKGLKKFPIESKKFPVESKKFPVESKKFPVESKKIQ